MQKKIPREDITNLLLFLKETIGVDDFKEPNNKQRFLGMHLINLIGKIGKEEAIKRLNGILSDDFKHKNCNSITYLYREMKSFINKPKKINSIKI